MENPSSVTYHPTWVRKKSPSDEQLLLSLCELVNTREVDALCPDSLFASQFVFKKVSINSPGWKLYSRLGLPANSYTYAAKSKKIKVLEYKKTIIDKCKCQLKFHLVNNRMFYFKIAFNDSEKNKFAFIEQHFFYLLDKEIASDLKQNMFSAIKHKKVFSCLLNNIVLVIENHFDINIHIFCSEYFAEDI